VIWYKCGGHEGGLDLELEGRASCKDERMWHCRFACVEDDKRGRNHGGKRWEWRNQKHTLCTRMLLLCNQRDLSSFTEAMVFLG
jgi:hypothetical protein